MSGLSIQNEKISDGGEQQVHPSYHTIHGKDSLAGVKVADSDLPERFAEVRKRG